MRSKKSRIYGYHNSCWVPYLDNFLCYLIKNEPTEIGKANVSNLPRIIMGMHSQKIGA